MMHILLIEPTGAQVNYNVADDATIGTLRHLVLRDKGVPLEFQRLSLRSKLLDAAASTADSSLSKLPSTDDEDTSLASLVDHMVAVGLAHGDEQVAKHRPGSEDYPLEFDIRYGLDGGGARCESTDCVCRAELCCFQFGLTSNFNHCLLCCCKASCNVL
jgi:hypothetical protein